MIVIRNMRGQMPAMDVEMSGNFPIIMIPVLEIHTPLSVGMAPLGRL